jgi:hypothetical protein
LIPKSLSATALHVAELCLSRYAAEHIWRTKGPGGHAANLGTAVHGALELFVKATEIDKSQPRDFMLLEMFFKKSYMETFDTHELGDGYEEGLEMLRNWFARTSFEGVEVISCEKKDFFPVPTSAGVIPFNYIWDRFDKIGPMTFKVVDYKSSVWNVRPEDLKRKIQPRAYALAAAIQLKAEQIEYDKIWVEFDMLRYERVGIVFTREEITQTWSFIRSIVEDKILPTPPDKAPETLNSECRFCVRKGTCNALKTNIAAGGVHGLTIEQVVDRRAALEFQLSGIKAAIDEFDNVILTTAKQFETLHIESENNEANIGLTKTNRAVNADQVEMIVGDEIFEEYGAKSMAVGQWEKLCKDKRLSADQKAKLKQTVYKPPGTEKVYVKSKSAFDDPSL